MGNDLRVWIFDGGEHAVCHRSGVKIHVGVHRADHDLELRKNFV